MRVVIEMLAAAHVVCETFGRSLNRIIAAARSHNLGQPHGSGGRQAVSANGAVQPADITVTDFMQVQIQNTLKCALGYHVFHGDAARSVLMKGDHLIAIAFQNLLGAQRTGCGGSQHGHGDRNPVGLQQPALKVLDHAANRSGGVLQNLLAEKIQPLQV